MTNKDKLVDAIGKIDDKYIDEANNIKNNKFIFDWALTGKILTGVLCLLVVFTIIPSFFRMGKTASRDMAMVTGNIAETPQAAVSEENDFGNLKYDESVSMSDSSSSLLNENKKLIVTGYMNIETLDFDNLVENLKKSIEEVGGYIQNSSISTNRYENRNYDASIRIPADKYNDFLNKTKGMGNVTWYNENKEDITDTYVDLEARLKSLKAEENKVLEFYDQATNIEELMSIENRLTDIRYEIDSIETNIKNYDLLTNYSTLTITVIETKTYTDTNDNFFSRISLSFKNGITNFINSFENFVIDVVYNIWGILIVIVLVIIAVVVIKKIKKNKK